MSALARLNAFVSEHLYALSIGLRLVLVLYSVLHDAMFRVKYTDIDYMIIVDGARFILEGQTPFARTTYRYTPILALLVLPSVLLFDAFGKLVFASCDVAVMYLTDRLLRHRATSSSRLTLMKLFIAFNPIVLIVSTRGNSDTLITLFALVAIVLFELDQYALAAGVLGFAAHFKIYPLIYVPSFAFGVWTKLQNRRRRRAKPGSRPPDERPLARAFVQWLRIVFASGVAFVVMFALPTALCYLWCGKEYIAEAFLYHVTREDHRHNFSPYWLLMYLNMAGRAQGYGIEYAPGLLAFLPQAVVLLFASWMLRRNVAQACCVVTVLFIAFNKVCTVQYFVWFIPLLCFVFYQPRHRKNVKPILDKRGVEVPAYQAPSYLAILLAFAAWAATIPIWVTVNFPLEFLGENAYGRVWLASCLFFLATTSLAGWLGRVSYLSQLALPTPEQLPTVCLEPTGLVDEGRKNA